MASKHAPSFLPPPRSRDQRRVSQDATEAAKVLSTLGSSKGGLARAQKLTPARRREIARQAAVARWGVDPNRRRKKQTTITVSAISLLMAARAILLLEGIRRAPPLHATRREALLAYVCGIIQVVVLDFDRVAFYCKHAGTDGAAYVTLDLPVDEVWAHLMIDDALLALRD